VISALEAGDPPIVTDWFPAGLILNPQLLEPGEEELLIAGVKRVLEQAGQKL
jgi:hypothetical protein